MPRPRTRPVNEPNGYEKSSVKLRLHCTETERLTWKLVFGHGKVADTARALLNAEACRRAGIPTGGVQGG